MARERVETDKRRAMTPARKKRIHEAWGGKCWFCRMPVPESGPEVVYDHVQTLYLTGSDADEAIGPIHALTCNKIKTAADLTRIAKTKRQAKKFGVDHDPDAEKPPSRLRSRGFDRALRKRFDGTVVPRTPR